MKNIPQCTKNAFTLIELSVTLVSIALLVALISGGAHLLQGARMTSMIAQLVGIDKAISAFGSTYDQWPGDMKTATDFFASTTNGDGDRFIENINGPNNNESLRAWQHLQEAGLMNTNLSGIGGGTGNGALANVNVPATSLNEGGISLQGNINGISGLQGNLMIIGAPVANTATTGPLFNGADSFKIDNKIDDGIPVEGFIRQTNAACINATPTPDEYDASDPSIDCTLYMLLDRE